MRPPRLGQSHTQCVKIEESPRPTLVSNQGAVILELLELVNSLPEEKETACHTALCQDN